MKENKHSLKISRSCFGDTTLDGYPIATYTNHFKILNELGIGDSQRGSISITQLLRHKDRIFAFFDDGIRAEKCNSDFKEVTIGEYEDFINGKD